MRFGLYLGGNSSHQTCRNVDRRSCSCDQTEKIALSSQVPMDSSTKPGVFPCRAWPELKHFTTPLFRPMSSPQIFYPSLTRASAYQIMCCLSSSCRSAVPESKFRLLDFSGARWCQLLISWSSFEDLNSNISSWWWWWGGAECLF